MEITQNALEREKFENSKEGLRDAGARVRRSNICLIIFPKNGRENKGKFSLKEIPGVIKSISP